MKVVVDGKAYEAQPQRVAGQHLVCQLASSDRQIVRVVGREQVEDPDEFDSWYQRLGGEPLFDEDGDPI